METNVNLTFGVVLPRIRLFFDLGFPFCNKSFFALAAQYVRVGRCVSCLLVKMLRCVLGGPRSARLKQQRADKKNHIRYKVVEEDHQNDVVDHYEGDGYC